MSGTVDNEEDPLQELIDEAEGIMASLDHATDQVFSIDSDEEEDKVKPDDLLSSKSAKPIVEDHPLSMTRLADALVPSQGPPAAAAPSLHVPIL